MKIYKSLRSKEDIMNFTENIIEWLHTQKDWLQEAAERLLKNDILTQQDISELTEYLKTEDGIKTTNHRNFNELIISVNNYSELRLDSIGNIQGIANLAPKSPLKFGQKNLVVIYGHNGSGKSSYSKIIKSFSGKSRTPDLSSNVFFDIPKNQSCAIDYSYASDTHSIIWDVKDGPIDILRAIDIFDTEESNQYLGKEKTITYTPKLIKVFEELAKSCDLIKNQLVLEQQNLVSALPDVPSEYSQTEYAIIYKSLKWNIKESELHKLITWTTEDEAELNLINERLKELDPITRVKEIKATKIQLDSLLLKINQVMKSYSFQNLDALFKIKLKIDQKKKIAEEAAKINTKGLIDGVGSDTWKAMWEAARAYSTEKAYPNFKFPVLQEAKCVLCQQDLLGDTKERLASFEEFVQGTLEQDVKQMEKAYQSMVNSLASIPKTEEIKTLCIASKLTDEWYNYLVPFFNDAQIIRDKIRTNELSTETINKLPNIEENFGKLKNYSLSLEEQAILFEKDAQQFDRPMAITKKLNHEMKKWISQQSVQINKEIERLKLIQQYDGLISLTNSRPISTKASSIAEEIITESFVSRFNAELNKLGANKIRVELVKAKMAKGTPYHKIQLKSAKYNLPIDTVLSEGERRIVTLAAFLADVINKPYHAPFIFDDPISSLDQSWEEKTIERLIELSQTRQVIVFTHRLSMLGILSDKSNDLHTIHIRQEPWGAGEVGEIPLYGKRPESALKDLKNNRLTAARKAFLSEGMEIYYPLAKAICSDLRILTERIVEFVFLADVVQRHRRAVNTQGKIHKLASITSEDCDLIEEIMTKYSCYEHSQSLEAPSELPEPEELLLDIDKLLDWHSEFTKRAI